MFTDVVKVSLHHCEENLDLVLQEFFDLFLDNFNSQSRMQEKMAHYFAFATLTLECTPLYPTMFCAP